MQVGAQIECTTETLNERDDPGARAAASREPRPVGKIGLDGADDDGKTAIERVRLACEASLSG